MEKHLVPVGGETIGWARFLAWTAATAATALLCAFLFVTLTVAAGRENLPFQELINYQRAKLAGTVGDVIFVGDSSLGNALDAKLWTSLSGRSATNLALSGSYGYAGSLAMIEAVVKRRRPTDVIIMQTAEMMMRSSTVESIPPLNPPRGIAEQLERLRQFWLDNMNLEQLQASFKFVSNWAGGELPARKVFSHDYIMQRGTTQPVPTVARFNVTKIKPDNVLILRQIADLCRKEELNCIYMHGPLANPVCKKVRPYFNTVNALIEGAGLVVAGIQSPCLSAKDTGDAPDHTAPGAKSRMTARIMKIVRPYLSVPR